MERIKIAKNARLGIEYRMEKREMSNLETISENTQIVESSTAIKREIIKYPAAIESTSRRVRLARPQPRLTLRAKIRIPISTPEIESHVRSKRDTYST